MVNPFDRNFFKFFIGFLCILAISFAIMYFVGKWGDSLDKQAASLFK
jgi:hypothetical protein